MSKGACGIAPETQAGVVSGVHPIDHHSNAHAVLAKVAVLWEPGTNITYSFFGGTKNQKDAVDRVAPEWTLYAKLNLQRQDDSDTDAMIRIAFDPKAGSWSSVGKGALNVKDGGITMNLGWLEDSPTVSDNDRGTILHEWGHALGLMHEHQSPARGGTITLKTDKVLEYYHLSQGWGNALIQSQILNVYNVDDVSNYSKLDTHSIMMYFMPGSLNDQNITVDVNNQLSDMDKAYMVINYPRTVQHPKASEWTLEKALDVAGVPAAEQKDILSCRNDVSSLRAYFAAWNKEARANEYAASPSPQPVPSQSTPVFGDDVISRLLKELLGQYSTQPIVQSSTAFDEPARIEHGIWSGLVGALKHPIFQEVIFGLINGALAQNGLNPATFPSQTPAGASYMPNPFATAGPYDPYRSLWSDITNILQNPIIQTILSTAVNSAFDVHKPTDSSDDIQHGIFSNITSVFGHPIVRQALSSIVDAFLTQRGLHPATVAQYPAIQQSVWSGFVGILKHPAFQQAVSGIVNAVLTQRAINPSAAPASVEHSIFSDAGKLLSHPLVSTVLTTLINAALTQRGLHPDNIATTNPEIQQGIWSGVVTVLKHPAFRRAVGTIINATLTQHGLKPTTATDAAGAPQQYPDNVQQGIWSGIVGVIQHPLFRNVLGSIVDAVLTQHALNPAAAGLPSSGLQYGINPQAPVQNDPFAAQHFLSALPMLIEAATALLAILQGGSAAVAKLGEAQYGLYSNGARVPPPPPPPPRMNAAFLPGSNALALNSIWPGIISLLQDPLFQNILGPIIGVLKQNALNPTAAGLFPPGKGIIPQSQGDSCVIQNFSFVTPLIIQAAKALYEALYSKQVRALNDNGNISYAGVPQASVNDTQQGLYFNRGGPFVPPPPPPRPYPSIPHPPPPPFGHYGLYSNNAIAAPPVLPRDVIAEQLNGLAPLGRLDPLSYGGKSPIVPAVTLTTDDSAWAPSEDMKPHGAVFAGDWDVPVPPGYGGRSPIMPTMNLSTFH